LSCMSVSSSLAVLLAIAVALAGFSGVSLSAPVGYPEDSRLDNGLVREIVFDPGDYRSPCNVMGRLVYLNPTGADVTFDLGYRVRYNVSLDGVYYTHGGRSGEGKPLTVTVPAGGEYIAYSVYFQANSPGFYEVEWDGMWRGVYVARGGLIARIVTDKSVYHLNENGYATIEYYNPGSVPVSFAPPTPVAMGFEIDGVKLDRVMMAYISWMISRIELAPGETFRIMRFYFQTPEAGRLTLTALGASETVLVLPER